MVYAFMNAVTKNSTLKELARHEGRKLQDINYVDPMHAKNLRSATQRIGD